jgi:hypothetical protein
MHLAKICDEVLVGWAKKQKSKTNSGPEITAELRGVIRLPNFESDRLWLPIHELWDEERRAVTSESLLM